MSFFEGLNAEKYDRQYSDRQLFARIAEYFKPQLRRFIWVTVWMIVLGVILAALPVVVARLVDLLQGQPNVSVLAIAGAVLVLIAFANWGLTHARDRIKPTDLDPTVLLWGFRKRAMLNTLPERQIVLLFEFSGVPPLYAKFRRLWLLLERSGADVCLKDPGFPVDLLFRGKVTDFVGVYLGHATWRDVAGTKIVVEGDRELAREAPSWIRLDKVVGKDFPPVRPAPAQSLSVP